MKTTCTLSVSSLEIRNLPSVLAAQACTCAYATNTCILFGLLSDVLGH